MKGRRQSAGSPGLILALAREKARLFLAAGRRPGIKRLERDGALPCRRAVRCPLHHGGSKVSAWPRRVRRQICSDIA